MKRLIVGLALLVHAGVGQLEAETIWTWNWDSGTTEGWAGYLGRTDLTIESGRNGTTALGLTPNDGAIDGEAMIVLEGHNIDPGSPVGGNFGNYVPMTYDMYVDANKEMGGVGNYVDLWIYGESSFARFHTYPAADIGSIEALDDGWYRHHLGNRFHHAYSSYEEWIEWPVGRIRFNWNWNYQSAVLDNLTIHGEPAQPIPEPSSLVVCSLVGAGVGVGAWRRRRKRKAK